MSSTESRYESRVLAWPAPLVEQAEASHPGAEFRSDAEWLRCVREEFPKFLPYLRNKCAVEFRGRVLEIGAGAGWFSAELSKLPLVVEVVCSDVSARLLQTEAPRLFKLVQANSAKIIRTPMDFTALAFPDRYFDQVVSADALHQATNLRRVLREVRRVLKPGGTFVALREPIRSARADKTPLSPVRRAFTLAEYRQAFELAGLKLLVKNVTLARGLRHYFSRVLKGTAPARYAFIATKPLR